MSSFFRQWNLNKYVIYYMWLFSTMLFDCLRWWQMIGSHCDFLLFCFVFIFGFTFFISPNEMQRNQQYKTYVWTIVVVYFDDITIFIRDGCSLECIVCSFERLYVYLRHSKESFRPWTVPCQFLIVFWCVAKQSTTEYRDTCQEQST